MKIIDSYILRTFLKPFVLGLVSLIGIVSLVDFFERIDRIIKADLSFLITLKYFLYRLPSTFSLVIPAAVLLSALFSLTSLKRDNEMTAIQAGGISVFWATFPLVLFALLISGLMLACQEILLPSASKEVSYIEEVMIKKKLPQKDSGFKDISFYGGDRRFIWAKTFNLGTGRMKEVQIIKQGSDALILERLDAEFAKWEEKEGWILFNGVWRKFSSVGEPVEEVRFKERKTKLKISPAQVRMILNSSQEESKIMSLSELSSCVKLLKETGNEFKNRLVDLHLKISSSFACLIMAILGISLGLKGSLGGRMTGFGLSVGIGFLYWAVMAILAPLGYVGILAPFISAWGANLLFLMAGILIMKGGKY